MPLTEHLEELRIRLIRSVMAYLGGLLISYLFARDIFLWLSLPLSRIMKSHPGSNFVIRSISEGFMVELKVAMIAGVFVASPVIFYQIWKFIAPGLYAHERKLALPVIISATALFSLGAFFGYWVIFPATFDFLMSYTTPDIPAQLSIDDYLDFAAKLLVGFGIIFELPLVIFILAWLGIVNHQQLRAIRRYVIVFNFVVAAVITPPDVVSQLGVGLPLLVLYEVGVILAWIVGRKRRTDAEVYGEESSDEVGDGTDDGPKQLPPG